MSQPAEALLKQLKNPFDPKFVKWRVGATNADKTKGIALAYIDSREVTKRLDDVCGIERWRDRLIEVNNGFISEIDIKINGEWVTRSNAAGNTQLEAVKGGASDAFKRAASKWGVGRYLYYLPNVWVPIKPQGKSYALAQIPDLPEWALPGRVEDWQDVAEMEATVQSGEDSMDVTTVIDRVEQILSCKTLEDWQSVDEMLTPDEKVIFVNQLNAKRRELLHEAEINADHSGSAPTE